MRITLGLTVAACLLAGCSAAERGEPGAAAPSSTDAAATTPTVEPEPPRPPDPCDLLEPFQLKRMFPRPGDYRKATWTHELTGKDGNFYGCVGTLRDFNYVRYGFAVTPRAYLREYKQGKLFGEDLSPAETPGLGDRGYVREGLPTGYEAMAKTGDWTVYVTSMGARDHEDVVAALQYLLGQAGPGMTESPVQLAEPCPSVDSPEVTAILGEVDVAVGTEHRGSVFCAYHDPATRTQLELSAYTLDPTAAALYRVSTPRIDRSTGETLVDPPPGRITVRRVDPDGREVQLLSFLPRTSRLSVVSLRHDLAGAAKDGPVGGDSRAMFRHAEQFVAEHG